ncbi:MAG: hypothetical protein U0136_10675 [Bdellovibrionota bacterium]
MYLSAIVLLSLGLCVVVLYWARPRRVRTEAGEKEVAAFFDALRLYLEPVPTAEELNALRASLDAVIYEFVFIAILSRPDPGKLDNATRALIGELQNLNYGLSIGQIRNVFYTFESRRRARLPEAIWIALPASAA